MRVGLPSVSTTITLETWIGASCVTMPPVFAPRWVVRMRVCFLTRFTPSTSTLSSLGYAAMTLPLRPLSLPAMTTTVSPFFTFMASHHLRGERDDFHVALPPQLPADRPEDARTARVAALLDDDGGVLVELDVRAVGAPLLLGGADDDRPDDVALLHAGARDGVLDGRHDAVADARVAAAGATEYPDAQDLPGSGVVGDAQSRLLLDHVNLLCLPVLRPVPELGGTVTWPVRGSPRRATAWWPTADESPSAAPGRRCRTASRRAPSACWYGASPCRTADASPGPRPRRRRSSPSCR